MSDFDTLADRIRDEAAQASRAGQMERLEAIAREVERLRQGAITLGHTIEQQGRMVLDVTGLHHYIAEDGDGDWGAVWDGLYELEGKALREAAEDLRAARLIDPLDLRDDIAEWLCVRADRILAHPAPTRHRATGETLGGEGEA